MAWGRASLARSSSLAFAYFSNTALPSEEIPMSIGQSQQGEEKAERERLGVDMRLEKGITHECTAARRWNEQVMSSHALAPQAERQQSSPLNSAKL